MWPFRPRKKYGVWLTTEEAKYVSYWLQETEKLVRTKRLEKMPQEIHTKIDRAAVAFWLHKYSLKESLGPAVGKPAEKKNLEKALGAIVKAYDIHPLPIYLYERAVIFDNLGHNEEAKVNFQKFLDTQNSFLPSHTDSLIDARYIKLACGNAKNALALIGLGASGK
jgi:hypothetical protein